MLNELHEFTIHITEMSMKSVIHQPDWKWLSVFDRAYIEKYLQIKT